MRLHQKRKKNIYDLEAFTNEILKVRLVKGRVSSKLQLILLKFWCVRHLKKKTQSWYDEISNKKNNNASTSLCSTPCLRFVLFYLKAILNKEPHKLKIADIEVKEKRGEKRW